MSDDSAPITHSGSQPGLVSGSHPGSAETRRYRIIGVLGRGGFGTVYHARLESKIDGSEDFVKDVAIKLLSDVNPPQETLSRFRDEARILGRLRDRSIVSVDPPTRLDGRWGVVMEFVDGVDCRRLIREKGRLPPTVALGIVEEVARTLDNLWHHPGEDGQPMRLLHRDLKPSNLQVTPTGAVKVLDFGVARADFGQRETLTTGHIAGTVGYIAPERSDGVEDPRGDVFSLGVVLEELVTGRRPVRPGESSRSAARRLNLGTGPEGRSTPGSATGSQRSARSILNSRPPTSSPFPPGSSRTQPGIARSQSRLITNPPPASGIENDSIPQEVLRFALELRAPNLEDRPWPAEVEQRCAAMIRDLFGPTLREWAREHVHSAPLVPMGTPDSLVGQMLSETLARVSFDKPPPAPRGNPAFAAALLAVSAVAAMLVMVMAIGSFALVLWWSNQENMALAPQPPPSPVEQPMVVAPAVEPPPVELEPAAPVAVATPPVKIPRILPATSEVGTVSQEGANTIELVGDHGSFGGSTLVQRVPVGTYTVNATFGDSAPVPAGIVTVTSGPELQLRCDARFKRCMQR